MALAENVSRIGEADYLRLERQAETRSEYFDGKCSLRRRNTRSHLIATNPRRRMGNLLKSTGCVAYNTDLRIKVEATGHVHLSVMFGCLRENNGFG